MPPKLAAQTQARHDRSDAEDTLQNLLPQHIIDANFTGRKGLHGTKVNTAATQYIHELQAEISAKDAELVVKNVELRQKDDELAAKNVELEVLKARAGASGGSNGFRNFVCSYP